MDDESAQSYFNLMVVAVLLGIVFTMMGGCESLGLTQKGDGTAEFWRSLERQSGGASL